MSQGYRMSSPLTFRHYLLAVPDTGVFFPVETMVYRGVNWADIIYPSREEDAGRLAASRDRVAVGDDPAPEPFLVEAWSRAQQMQIVEHGGWHFIPLEEGDTYHLQGDKLTQLCQPGYWVPPTKGKKERRPALNFAVGTPVHSALSAKWQTMPLPFDMLRYCRTALAAIPPTEGARDQIYFVHPGESAKCHDEHVWWIGNWRAHQWLLEPVNFTQLPALVRERFV